MSAYDEALQLHRGRRGRWRRPLLLIPLAAVGLGSLVWVGYRLDDTACQYGRAREGDKHHDWVGSSLDSLRKQQAEGIEDYQVVLVDRLRQDQAGIVAQVDSCKDLVYVQHGP